MVRGVKTAPETSSRDSGSAWAEAGAPSDAPMAGRAVSLTAVTRYAPEDPDGENIPRWTIAEPTAAPAGAKPPMTRIEKLKRAETMRYDKSKPLTLMQKTWMVLDDPSYSKGACARPSVAARAA